MPIFKGLNIIQARHEVVSPKTGLQFAMRPMANSDEVALRTSIMTKKSSTLRLLTENVYSSMIEKAAQVGDNINTFKANTPNSDQELFLFGLYIITYGGTDEAEGVVCRQCDRDKPKKLNIDLTKCYHVEEYPGYKNSWDDILKKEVSFTHERLPGVTIILKEPTIAKVEEASDFISEDDKVDSYFNYIDRFIMEDGSIVESILDLLSGYKQLDVPIKREMQKHIWNEFEKYEPQIYHEYRCPECKKVSKLQIDILGRFLRMVIESLINREV